MDLPDEEPKFDPNLKKKKKKKTGFNIDAPLTEGAIPEEALIENGAEEEPKEVKDEVIEFEDGDFGKKKSSKKKKKPFSLDDFKDLSLADGEEKEANDGLDDLEFAMDFSTKLKKKIKKKKIGLDELLADLDKDNSDGVRDNEGGDSWLSSDRDYFYEELLDRAFSDLRERNPDLATGEKKKFMMKPPQVVRIGSKKTAFVNFSDICRLMHRMPKHLLQFLLSELGTSGSIDGSNQLIIKGKFQQKQIENVLRRYIKEYVTCHTCRSPDTMLQKDARLYFLQCEQCNSRCSVTPIKSGFQAVANKQQRQAIKAGKT